MKVRGLPRLVTWAWLVGAATLATMPRADAEVRALIWAADYRATGDADLALPNTLVDAQAVAALFRRLGVADVRLVENPTSSTWQTETEALAARLTAEDVALLYYAGHAVQVNGQNYFLASDGATLVASDQVLAPVMARAKGTVFLIDACRDNPFRNAGDETRELKVAAADRSRAVQSVTLAQLAQTAGGLSQMSNLRGKNTIVVFSTDPGNVALDGDAGRGSPFANAVVREFGRRQSLDSAIRKITADVDKATQSRQSPWRQGDLTFPLFLAGQPRFPVP